MRSKNRLIHIVRFITSRPIPCKIEITHALLHSHTRFTYQWFIQFNQSLQVQKSIYHFHDCSILTQSSHVQYCGLNQCGDKYQW
ncbi:uncharacterized protein [Blastocystis hominis]|uniref:Uncharacterized protein n=1 Tax=Blastocystis hominis TaxID=12968 RepID=D8MA87_BLAHO|nr:uncharacterized protein [Blastocystis hominis]CBK24976.2 unnamed protein product [Blastocystis hominis]|eukprot:XP_012899024.1 uncharacterized protein [Blastocystis hominis]